MYNLDVCQSKHVISNATSEAAAPLSFDVLFLEISQESLSILWYRWTFQGEKQFIVGSLLFTGVSIADNGSQG